MEKRPNIIFLVLDSVRADHVSCYGYERSTTPTIDRIAQEGAMFCQAIASAPWTLPSHASIFTGLFPTEHSATQANTFLNKDIFTLPQVLQRLGYTTAGFSNNPWVDPLTGLDRGFDLFMGWQTFRPDSNRTFFKKVVRKLGFENRSWMAENTIKHILSWMSSYVKQQSSAPFFLFVNLMEAHLPYSSPAKFVKSFDSTKPYNEHINYDDAKYITGQTKMSVQDFEILNLMYDGALAYLDDQLDRLYTSLDKLRILDNTLLILTSDHGENLGDHGLMAHILCLYDTLLKVPLILRYPTRIPSGTIVKPQVQLQDIFSTILQMARATIVDEYSYKPERSILNKIKKQTNNQEQNFAFAEYSYPQLTFKRLKKYDPEFDNPQLITALKCIRTSKFKYIWSERGIDEFYHLEVDPGETQNLIEQTPVDLSTVKNEMQNTLQDWEKSLGIPETQDKSSKTDLESVDETVIERLRNLGYLE